MSTGKEILRRAVARRRDKTIDRAATRRRDKTIDETIDRGATRSRDKTIDETIDRAATRGRDKTIDETIDRAATRSRDKTIDETIDRAATRSRDKTIDENIDRAATRSRDKTIDETIDHAVTRRRDKTMIDETIDCLDIDLAYIDLQIQRRCDEMFKNLCVECERENKKTKADILCIECRLHYCFSCFKFHTERQSPVEFFSIDHWNLDLGRRDEMFDFLCVVCKGKNKKTTAKMFCIECHDYYCSSCVKCHDDIPPLKTHQILDKSTAPLPAVPTERCKDHKDKPVDMYCKNHNVVGCSTCMLVKHSSCTDKHYIPDLIETDFTRSNIFKNQFRSITNTLHNLHLLFKEEKEELSGKQYMVLREIREFRENIYKLLDQFEKNIVQELDQSFQSLTDNIDSRLGELKATITEINAAQDHLKSAAENMSQKFVSIMQAVSSAKEIIVTSERQLSSPEIYFLANQKLQTLFSETQDLGSICQKPRIVRQKYPVKVQSDKHKCTITSICILESGTIILADCSNRKLKRLRSSTYVVRDCCDIPQIPLKVCAITDTEVAVSCQNDQIIQFVNVGVTMKKTRKIKIDFWYAGLAYADERLFVSDSTAVYMFSLSGELQQLYNYQSVQVPRNILQDLAINNDMSRIYVVDHGLNVLDMNGQLVGKYNLHKLTTASGVCLDNNDNVLVCGMYSINVLQFNPDGNLIKEILKTDKQCTTVCCYKNKTKLIVGFLYENKIEVCDIRSE